MIKRTLTYNVRLSLAVHFCDHGATSPGAIRDDGPPLREVGAAVYGAIRAMGPSGVAELIDGFDLADTQEESR